MRLHLLSHLPPWLLLLAIPLWGCREVPREALRFGLAAAPVTLDPRYATDAASERIDRLLYRRLTDFDAASKPVGSLAHWRVVTPTRYRFMLGANGRTFHDGSRLTAADVKATYDSILNPAVASPHRASLANIARIEVQDADTLDFFLREPDLQFPSRLGIGILPKRLIDSGHPFLRQPVGSGPLAFLDWPAENLLRLKRTADGQVFEFITVPDPTVRVLKLLSGEIDMLQNDLPPELVKYLAGKEQVQVLRAPGGNLVYLGFNLEDPVTGRREVREAIAHAIDRGAIIRYILGDAARTAESVLPPEHWAGNPRLGSYTYDPALAHRLLRQAGFDDAHPPHIVYKTSSDPFRIRLATLIQHQLTGAGFSVDLRSYDWGTFYGDIKAGRFQMYSLSWVGIQSPDVFRYAFHSASKPPLGANRGRFFSPPADDLIERAQRADRMEVQAKLYRDLQQLVWETLVYVPLWYEDQVFIARREVQGYRVSADGNYDGLASVWVRAWARGCAGGSASYSIRSSPRYRSARSRRISSEASLWASPWSSSPGTPQLPPELRLGITTGFLGGLTTFSAFSAETSRYSRYVMKGTCLKFYVHEFRKHHGILLYEWLLEHAKKMGIHGGSAFRAIAGFGRHGVLHEEHFFELAGDLPVEVSFMVSDAEAQQLLDLVTQEQLQVFYVRMPVEFGALNGG